MDRPKEHRRATVAGAGLAALGAAWYANDRYAISHDIKAWLGSRNFFNRMNEFVAKQGDNFTVYSNLRFADKDAEALWFEGRTWTYRQMLMETDKIATFFHDHGVQAGDVVACFTTNSPEMIFSFLALSRLGAVVALVNTSLRNQTLIHCLKVVKAKMIISTADLAPIIVDLLSNPQPAISSISCISINLTSFPALKLQSSATSNITELRYEDIANITPADYRPHLPVKRGPTQPAFYIYTSGSTGLPKAVSFRNGWFAPLMILPPADYANRKKYLPLRIYSCLPLFHATALLIGMFAAFGNSGTFCLGRKFSARNFSRELVGSKATRMIYVGELCRYLLSAPPSPLDKQNNVIVATGNGLQKDVWNKFRERFGIPEIREFYRSTEGIAQFEIVTDRSEDAGYVGRKGPLGRYLETGTYLVKYDKDTDTPWRNPKTGFCEEVAVDEPGEAIGRVLNMDTYREYLDNPEANAKKLIRDVFEKGDLFQRTGDLLVRDSRSRVRFADRMGDTWRWRGENVSAGEVRSVISHLRHVKDANCYGVKLNGYDGQAGAAGITLGFDGDLSADQIRQKEDEFMAGLFAELRKKGLTIWQVPRLVRLTGKIETTATFKHLVNILKARSWHPDEAGKIGDRLYWLDGEQYKPLDLASWESIEQAKARL